MGISNGVRYLWFISIISKEKSIALIAPTEISLRKIQSHVIIQCVGMHACKYLNDIYHSDIGTNRTTKKVLTKMNGFIILFSIVNCIYSREITTISYDDRHKLTDKGLADVFKNEGAFVRPEIKV